MSFVTSQAQYAFLQEGKRPIIGAPGRIDVHYLPDDVILIDISPDVSFGGGGGGGDMLRAIYDVNYDGVVDVAEVALAVNWENVTDRPTTFPPSAHTHGWPEITGKPETFPPSIHTHAWEDLTNVPASFPPSAHTHAWGDLTDVPTSFPPSAHTHGWTEITDRPTTFPPSAHTHDWGDLTNVPASFPPSAHTHGWTEITDRPTTFPPSAHTHDWGDLTDVPTTFPPSAHTHGWTEITDRPTTFPPSAHTHDWGDLTGVPTSFPPSTHTHGWTEITGKPTTFPPEAHNHDERYPLMAGRSGGQTLVGGVNNEEELILSSTSAATKGVIRIGLTTSVNENPAVGSPTFEVLENRNAYAFNRFRNTSAGTSAASALIIANDINALFECGVLSSAHTAFPGYGAANASYFRAGASSSELNVIAANTSAPIRFFAGQNANATPSLRINPGTTAGFFTNSPTLSNGGGLDINAANLRLRQSRTINNPSDASQVGEINWQADSINVATSSGWRKAPLFWRFAPASVLYDLSPWTLGTNTGDDFLVNNVSPNGTGQWQWFPGAEGPSDAPYSYARTSWLRVNSKYNADSSPTHAVLYSAIAGGVNNYYWCRMMGNLMRGQTSRVGFVVMNSTRTMGGAFWIYYNSSTNKMQLIAASYNNSTPWLEHANALSSNVAYTTGWTTRFTSQEYDLFAVSAPIVGIRTLSTATDFVCTESTGVGLFRLAYVTSFAFTASYVYLFVEGNLSERKAAFYDFVGVGVIPV